MRKKFKLIGIIALAVIMGFGIVSCDLLDGLNGDEEEDGEKGNGGKDEVIDVNLTITGLAAWNGADLNVMVVSKDQLDAEEKDQDYDGPDIYGYGEIKNGSAAIDFIEVYWFSTMNEWGYEDWDFTESEWSPKANGNYWLIINLSRKTGGKDPVYGTDEVAYIYSNGKTYNVTVDEDFDIAAFMKTVPYFDFTQSTVDLSKFWQAPEGMLFGSGDGGDDKYDPDDPDYPDSKG